MKKKYFFLLLSLYLYIISYGQGSGCPQVFASADQVLNCTQSCTNISASVFDVGETTSYGVSSIPHSPPIAYNASGGIGVSVGTDDVWSSIINLPFPFCFFGQTYTTCKIGSNGGLMFNPSSGGGYNPWPFSASVPSAALTNAGHIFGPYHDIDPSVAGSVKYYTLGSAPCRTLVVVYNGLAHFDCTNLRSTHMMVLYETTNIIEVYVQQKQTCSGWNSGNTVIGIQNTAGTQGYTPPGRNTGAWTVSTPEAWQFKPNGAPIYTDIEWLENGSVIGIGNTINVCPTYPSSVYTARTIYTRCDGLQITTSDDVVVGFKPNPVVVVSPKSLFTCAGQNTTITANTSTPCTYLWSPGGQTTQSITVSPAVSTQYSVTVTDILTGCSASDTSNISIAQPTSNSCNVLYVSTTGTSAADGSKANPLDLATALQVGACNGTTIKMALGDYVTDTTITDVTSYLTLEGGYDETVNWEKVSTAGGTRILKQATMSVSTVSTINVGTGIIDESGANPRSVAVQVTNQTGFRFQDITIETEGLGGQSAMQFYKGVSIYGAQFNSCDGYDLVRTQVIAGTASNGYDQVWSQPATDGGSSFAISATLNGANTNLTNTNLSAGSAGSGGVGTPNGANGSSSLINLTGTPFVTQDINFNLAGQPTIRMDDISCTNTVVNFTGTSNNNWTFGTNSLPNTATGTNVATQYSTIGRKTISFNGNNYLGFSNILLDDQIIPAFTTSATFVNGHYRVCAGEAVGFTATNGGVGYVYEWDFGGGLVPNTLSGTNLELVGGAFSTPGVYTIQLNYVTSCCGASAPTTLEIYVEEVPIANLPADINQCLGDVGGSTLTVSGLTNNGSVLWSPPTGLDRIDSTTVIALPSVSTMYIVTLSDSTGLCHASDTINVNVIDLDITISQTVATCATLGTASANVLNGSGNYSFAWSNGGNTQNITGLQAGNYEVLVTDNVFGCTDSSMVTVLPGPGALIGIDSTYNVSCFGENDGRIIVYIQGGTPPYTYSWSNSASTVNTNNLSDSIVGLSSGTYDVTVTDNTGCTFIISSIIDEPSQIIFSQDSISDPTCVGVDNGYINIRPDGGTRPYSFVWSNLMPVVYTNDQIFATNLSSGTYILTLTDFVGCQDSISITLNAPQLESTISETICFGDVFVSPNGTNYILQNDSIIIDTISTLIGCDSIVTVNVQVDNYIDIIQSDTICQGSTIVVNNITYTNSGHYLDTAFYVVSGCDSVHFDITLQIDSSETFPAIDTTICEGESITVNGVTYTSNQNNTLDTAFYTQSGCDSMYFDITLHIDTAIILPAIDTTICEGESLTVNGVTYTSNQNNTLDTAFYIQSGCDSMYFDITLHIDSTVIFPAIDTTICEGESLTVNGVTYTTNQTNTLDTAFYIQSGCDSMYFDITLHIDSTTIFPAIDTTICEGESITVNGVTYSSNQNNTLDTAFYTQTGCDSMYFDITLHIDSTTIFPAIDTVICGGQSITVNGVVYNTNQIHTLDTAFFSQSGCDSMYFDITLQVESIIPVFDITTTCTNDISQAITITDTLFSVVGCDSFYIVDSVFFVDMQLIISSESICEGDTLNIFGLNQTQEGIYTDTIFTSLNCIDTIFTVELIVNDLPLVDAGDDASVIIENNINLTATGANTYVWSTGENTQTITVSPDVNTTYYVNGTDINNCSNSDTVIITVLINDIEILIPNAFSPNDDGLNDSFGIVNQDDFENISMRVYNRWGQMVFESENGKVRWDGYYKDVLQPIESYVYYIEATNVVSKELISISGPFALIK